MAIAELFQISVDELLSNEKHEKKLGEYLYESKKEYDIDCKKDYDINLGGAHTVELKSYEGEKIVVNLLSNVIKNIASDYKIKIDDIYILKRRAKRQMIFQMLTRITTLSLMV